MAEQTKNSIPAALPQFLAPTYTTITVPSSGVVQVCPARPNRYMIWFMTNNAQVIVAPGEGVVGSNVGMLLAANGTNQYLITFRSHGVVVAVPWYGYGQSGGKLLVVESCYDG